MEPITPTIYMTPDLDKRIGQIEDSLRELRQDTIVFQQSMAKQMDSIHKILEMLTKSQTKLTEEYQKIADDNHKIIEENKTFLKSLEDIQSTENNQLKPLLEKLSVNNERLLENIQSPVFQARVYNRIWRSTTSSLTVMNPLSMIGLTNLLMGSIEKDKLLGKSESS